MTIAPDAIQEFAAATDNQPMVFTEREALALVAEPLARLRNAPADDRFAFVVEALDRIPWAHSYALALALKGSAAALLRGLSLSPVQAVRLVETAARPRQTYPFKAILSALDGIHVTPALRDALTQLRGSVDEWHGAREARDIHARIDALLNGPAEEPPVAPVAAWSAQVFAESDASPRQLAWRALFLHARGLKQSTPARKWCAEAVALADRVGRATVIEAAHRWLALGPMPGNPNEQVPADEADYQKGFIATLGALGDASVAPAIADFAAACFRKIPQIGAVSHRVGNACLWALGAMPGFDSVAQLSRLATRVKYDVARRLIEKALDEAAARNNVSRDDLEAMSVPTFGLDAAGARTETLGEATATLAIVNRAASLSLSARAKANHPEAVPALKKAAKDLDAILATQRLRLERKLLSEAWCDAARWRAWYVDHPVTGAFARDLIWEVETTGAIRTAIWRDGALVDWAGNQIDSAAGRVRIWHPIRSDVQTVLAWRCWLEDHGVVQPFKQAHREVYLLTDAERAAGTYSNRFAAHLLRQHQFAALCRDRGWQFKLMGQWDSHNTPHIVLPRHGLRAEYHVEFPETEEVTAHAVYLTIGTGHVQFFDATANPDRFEWPPRPPMRLEDVPPLVFTEVMRDIDLFVGVASIGADPTWGVERPTDPHIEYWRGYAFGELTESAVNRRATLERLLPRLAIAPRCSLDGRFLIVRGDLREYRIHIGSANVIMEPSGRYLCIVQGGGDTAARVALPFEGDRTLALILSKAFLLANDAVIKDPTITRQFP
ncbi:MAG: DUF4132 domain-containing protein [Bryobacteraceae bacterium]